MNKKQIAHFEKRLLEERKRVLKELGHYDETFGATPQGADGDLSSYSFHMADQGTDAMEREKAFLFASQEGRFLWHIDEALRRLYRSPETFGQLPPVRRARSASTGSTRCRTRGSASSASSVRKMARSNPSRRRFCGVVVAVARRSTRSRRSWRWTGCCRRTCRAPVLGDVAAAARSSTIPARRSACTSGRGRAGSSSALTIAALVILCGCCRTTRAGRLGARCALALVCGGALGNLIDRLVGARRRGLHRRRRRHAALADVQRGRHGRDLRRGAAGDRAVEGRRGARGRAARARAVGARSGPDAPPGTVEARRRARGSTCSSRAGSTSPVPGGDAHRRRAPCSSTAAAKGELRAGGRRTKCRRRGDVPGARPRARRRGHPALDRVRGRRAAGRRQARRAWSSIPAPGNWTGTLVNALKGRGQALADGGAEERAGHRPPARQGYVGPAGRREDGARACARSARRSPSGGSPAATPCWLGPHRREDQLHRGPAARARSERPQADGDRVRGAARRAPVSDRLRAVRLERPAARAPPLGAHAPDPRPSRSRSATRSWGTTRTAAGRRATRLMGARRPSGISSMRPGSSSRTRSRVSRSTCGRLPEDLRRCCAIAIGVRHGDLIAHPDPLEYLGFYRVDG